MLFILSQRRKERKGCAGYIGLSNLGGLARENISRVMRLSRAVFSLAKARRTQRQRRVYRTERSWRLGERKYLASNEALACCFFSRKGAEDAKAAQGIQVFATLAAWREKISREERGSRMLFILSQRRGEHKEMYDKSCRILNNHI